MMPLATPSDNLTRLDDATRTLVRLSAIVTAGTERDVRDALIAADIPTVWVEELILQTYLFAGFPRALNAMREWRRSVSKGLATSATARAALRQRIEQVMSVTIQREMEAIEKRLGFLATVGANATFVGLFGTVWGIMNSFGHIAQSKNTSLAVVAPGISEALFATAIGLVAAIPAAGAYNILSGQVARYAQQLESFAGEFITILSRQLEEQV